jgi:hypothetical protein
MIGKICLRQILVLRKFLRVRSHTRRNLLLKGLTFLETSLITGPVCLMNIGFIVRLAKKPVGNTPFVGKAMPVWYITLCH